MNELTTTPWATAVWAGAARGGPASKGKSTVTGEDERPRSGAAPIVALWVPALHYEAAFPELAAFEVGREGTAVTLAHESVSRRHWRVERRAEGVIATDLASKNGTWTYGPNGPTRAATVQLQPLVELKIGQLRVWPLTPALRDARRALAYYLGHSPEADRLVMELLADAAASRSFVIYGEPSFEPTAIVDALIAASPRRLALRRDVKASEAPGTPLGIRDLAAETRRGVVTVPLEILARAGERACATWQSTMADPQWDLMTLFHGGPRIPQWEAMPRPVTIPTVAQRFRNGEAPLMVAHLMRTLGAGWSIDSLSHVELPPRALVAYAWPDNHAELRLMVTYAAARLSGQSHIAAARAMNIERSRMARMVARWGGAG